MHWLLSTLGGKKNGKRGGKKSTGRNNRFRPALEPLEDRLAPATVSYPGGGLMVLEGENSNEVFWVDGDKVGVQSGTNSEEYSLTKTKLAIYGKGGTDSFYILDLGDLKEVTISGGSGPDKLAGYDPLAFGLGNIWQITGYHAGKLNGIISFTSVEHLQGSSSASDAFLFENEVQGSVNSIKGGDGGNDVIDFSKFQSTSVKVDVQKKTTWAGVFDGIEKFIGGQAADTFVGSDQNSDWFITGQNSGDYSTGTGTAKEDYSFESFENLTGGKKGDVFWMLDSDKSGVAGTIDGQQGDDLLVYHDWEVPIVVDLKTYEATGIGRFKHVDAVFGGESNEDVLIAPDGAVWHLTGAAKGFVSWYAFNGSAVVEQIFSYYKIDAFAMLKRDYGFHYTGSYSENWTGQYGEKWFKDRRGDWYSITPDGKIRRWVDGDKDLSNDKLVAMISDQFEVFNHPEQLFDANGVLTKGEKEELSAQRLQNGFYSTGDYFENWSGEHSEKWFKDRYGVWHTITPDGVIRSSKDGDADLNDDNVIATVHPLAYDDPSLIFEAEVELLASQKTTLGELRKGYGFYFTGSYSKNWTKLYNEKWFRDRYGEWHSITPDGKIRRSDDGDKNLADDTVIETVPPLVYDDPTLLFEAEFGLTAAEQQQLVNLQTVYGFYFTGSYSENWTGEHNEKWFKDWNDSWCTITPDGKIRRSFDGDGDLSDDTMIGTVPGVVYDDPSLLFTAS